jgi:hypothetical protein
VSIMRILISSIISIWTKNNKLEVLSKSGIITMFLGPNAVFNYGFCMSYLCTAGIIWIISKEINNPFMKNIYINLIAIFICIPFILLMSGKISIFVFFFCILFSSVFLTIYVALALSFWIIILNNLFDFLSSSMIYVLNIFSSTNYFIYLEINEYYGFLYLLVLFILLYFIDKQGIKF